MFHRSRLSYFKKWHRLGYPFMAAAALGRVLVNVVLNGLAAMATLGLHQKIRQRLGVNRQLLSWYLRGCP